ncbi:MAG TPA: terminase small subunit [Rhodocyclaceae bacterium]|nr:terminase small subunit [Rhodocyclaceae bacterium]
MLVEGQETIADVFGVAPKTIVEWQNQGMPIAQRGSPGVPSHYDSKACIAWKIEIELRKVRSETPADRLARVKADGLEMDNFERKGLLVPAEQIEPKIAAAMVLAREQMQDEPARLARAVAGKPVAEAEELIGKVFDAFLMRMSGWQSADEIDDEDDE